MRAAVLDGPGQVVVDEVPAPQAGDDLVLVQVAYNGICGSDLGLIRAKHAANGADPVAWRRQILGHEFSGVVEAVGPQVTDFRAGDRVVAQPNYHCGACAACRRGLTNLCAAMAFHGIHTDGGGLAERTALPAANLHHVPDGMSLEQAALVEPLAVAYRAVARSLLTPDGCVLILGAGPIGACVALNVRAAGVGRVLVSDPSAPRRAALEALGFATLDPNAVDVAGHVRSAMDPAGADVVFECSGASAAFGAALSSVGPQGRIMLVGVSTAPLPLDVPALMVTEAVVMSSLAYQRTDFEAVIAAMAAGAYPLAGWVEHASLDELPTVIGELDSALRMKVLIDVAPAGSLAGSQ